MGCVANVTRAIKGVNGVAEVDINLPRGRARIGFDPARTTPDALAAAITAAGYPAHAEQGDDLAAQQAAEAHREVHRHLHGGAWKRRAFVGLIIWLPIESLHWILYLSGPGHAHHAAQLDWMTWLSVAAGTPV